MTKNWRRNKKALSTMVIVGVVVAVVVVAAVVAYWYMSQNPAAPSDSTTPTPEPSATGIADASSLRYSVSLTENGVVQGTYTFMGKSISTDDFSMRIELTDADGDTIYIFNAAQNKAWTYSGGEWVDISDYYSSQWDIWNALWGAYTNSLASWMGTGEHSYTEGGTTVRIYDIAVNPTLDDALFVHSS